MTMTTMTIEELTEVPIGESVRDEGARTWTRNETGFTTGAYTVPITALAEHATQFTRTVPLEVNQWRTYGGYYYLLGEADGEDRWWCVAFYSETGVPSVMSERAAWFEENTGLTDRPEWVSDLTLSLAREALAARLAASQVSTQQSTAVDPVALQDALTEWGQDMELDPDSSLWSIMQDHGMSVPEFTEEVTVGYVVNGSTAVSMATTDGQTYCPPGTSCMSVDDFEVDWTIALSHAFEVGTGECACHLLTYDIVAAALRDSGLEYVRFDFDEVDCMYG